MASIWRRTMVYLGLVDDDEYEEYEPYDEPQAQAPAPAAPLRRGARAMPEPVDSGYDPESSGVRTLPRDDGPTAPRPMEPRAEPRGMEPRGLGAGAMGAGAMGAGGL